jgi:hypothetical protein
MAKYNDPFNLTDIKRKPKGKDGQPITTGHLVVRGGPALTEAELSRIWGGDWRGRRTEIIFDDSTD